MTQPQRKRIIAANWKMQCSRAFLVHWINEFFSHQSEDPKDMDPFFESIVCAPYAYLSLLQEQILYKKLPIALGAQDISTSLEGAYTSQISGTMLTDIGCRYVLVGHSECRQYLAQSNQDVTDKFFRAKEAGLIPILCMGETLNEYEHNHTQRVVLRQLDAIIEREGVKGLENSLIAYEPVWAIGTGLSATPDQAQSVHQMIREHIATQDPELAASISILYGGSVKSINAAPLFAMPDIDGALVGVASLDAIEFLKIAKLLQPVV